jgi:hypothetical protein
MAGGTLEIFGNDYPWGTVSSGGTDTTSTTWTVSTQVPFPQANYTGNPPVIFHVADPALPSETIQVSYNNSNGTWTVVRGAENTAAGSHAAGFTIKQVASGVNGFGSFYQLANLASTSYTTVQNTATATNIASIYVPSYGTQPGGVAAGVQYELSAYGTMQTTSLVANASATLTAYWDTSTGTALASIVPHINATELAGTVNTPVSIESTVTFLNSTQAVAMIQMVWTNANALTTADSTALAVGGLVTVNGTSGAAQQLCLVWKWSTATNNTISVIGAAYQVQ